MINLRQHTLQSRHNRSSPLTHFVCVIITFVCLQGAIITSNLLWLMMAKFWLILPSFTGVLQGFVKLLQLQCQCSFSFIVLLFLHHTFQTIFAVLCPSCSTGHGGEWWDGWVGTPPACASRGGFWEVLFLIADYTGRSSWSVSLAQHPLCYPSSSLWGLNNPWTLEIFPVH